MDIQLMDRWNNLSTSEIRILKEIVARIESGEDKVPIRAVAQASYVSTASIVRLAKKLGLDGYSELLYSLKHERSAALPSEMTDYCRRAVASPGALDELGNLAKVIASGRYARMHVMGLGYSDLTAKYLCDRLLEHGFFASTKSPLDFRDDRPFLIIFVSESGETHDLMFVQDRCASRGIDDFLFTADAQSSLGVKTAHCILVERQGVHGVKDPYYFVVNCLMLIEELMARVREIKDIDAI